MKFKKYIYWIPSIIWALVILIASILPSDRLPDLWMDFFIDPDKIAHFLFYLTQSFLLAYTIKKSNSLSKLSALKMLNIFLAVFLYGIFIELLQLIIFAGRNGEILDVLANTIGIIVGLTTYIVLSKRMGFI